MVEWDTAEISGSSSGSHWEVKLLELVLGLSDGALAPVRRTWLHLQHCKNKPVEPHHWNTDLWGLKIKLSS